MISYVLTMPYVLHSRHHHSQAAGAAHKFSTPCPPPLPGPPCYLFPRCGTPAHRQPPHLQPDFLLHPPDDTPYLLNGCVCPWVPGCRFCCCVAKGPKATQKRSLHPQDQSQNVHFNRAPATHTLAKLCRFQQFTYYNSRNAYLFLAVGKEHLGRGRST